MRIFLIFFLFSISVKSQLSLTIKSEENKGTQFIVMEIFNSSDKTYIIPLDTISFKPVSQADNGNFRPSVELRYNNNPLKYESKVLELDDSEIDLINNGGKVPNRNFKYSLLEIKPKEKLLIPIQFNPFEFNIMNGKYDYFDILVNQNYSMIIYIRGWNKQQKNKECKQSKSRCFTGLLKSNSISIKWDLKNRERIEW